VDEKTLKILRLREGGNVRRCHTVPYPGEYTVGKHTFDMLAILHVLCPKASQRLTTAVLLHDVAERYTGDLPGSVVDVDPRLKDSFRAMTRDVERKIGILGEELRPEERAWLRAIDKVELWMWCHDQLNLGNDHVSGIVAWLEAWFEQEAKDLPQAVALFLKDYHWERTDG